MLTDSVPYCKELSGGLVLRSVSGMDDVERVAAFNGEIHDQGVAAMTRELILHHPATRPEHWLLVQDAESREVVSSMCLIPWALRYGPVSLRAGEAGIVGTRESHRRRGLVRAQFARLTEMLAGDGYHLSHIQGIPYFYRQFGYSYAMPLEGGWRLEPDQVPALREGALRVREATSTDLSSLVRLYDDAAADLDIHVARDAETWAYLLGPSTQTETVAETWLVDGPDGAPAGYVRVPRHGFGDGLIANETSRLSAAQASAVLAHLKQLCLDRHKPYIRLCLPEQATLVRAARSLGASDLGHYAWQVKLVDVARFLKAIAPVLERRIAASPFAGLTRDVVLDTYRAAYQVRFQDGSLCDVSAIAHPARSDMRLPPDLLPSLLLGYRSREELARGYHDVWSHGEGQHLIDVLFPEMDAYLYTTY